MKDYQGFDLKLAIVDAIPVLEFGISILLISIHFQSVLFLMGVILCVIAGCGKVVWKLILALQHKNVELLTKQFRYTMPSGFLLIILSLVMNYKKVHIQWKYPSNILFILVFI